MNRDGVQGYKGSGQHGKKDEGQGNDADKPLWTPKRTGQPCSAGPPQDEAGCNSAAGQATPHSSDGSTCVQSSGFGGIVSALICHVATSHFRSIFFRWSEQYLCTSGKLMLACRLWWSRRGCVRIDALTSWQSGCSSDTAPIGRKRNWANFSDQTQPMPFFLEPKPSFFLLPRRVPQTPSTFVRPASCSAVATMGV